MSKLSDENPVRDSSVAFIIRSSGLELEAITRTFNIMPSRTHRAGDPEPYLKKRVLSDDMWLLNSPLDAEEPMDEHLKWLAQQLEPHYEYIRTLKATANIYVYCGFTFDDFQSGFSLSPEALSLFTELGIPMEVSLLVI